MNTNWLKVMKQMLLKKKSLHCNNIGFPLSFGNLSSVKNHNRFFRFTIVLPQTYVSGWQIHVRSNFFKQIYFLFILVLFHSCRGGLERGNVISRRLFEVNPLRFKRIKNITQHREKVYFSILKRIKHNIYSSHVKSLMY